MSPTILVVEDEPSIAENILYALRTDGFSCDWVRLGAEAIERVRHGSCDLTILDVGLADVSGFEVCKAIRRFSEIPIIFLTARSEEIDRVVGLEIGGDDYVVKPFSPRELVARVRVIVRRSKFTNAMIQLERSPTVSPFTLDEARAKIFYRQRPLELTRYEYLLLKFLLAHPERVFSRAELMDRVWDSAETSSDRSVDAHIKSLRAKLRALDPVADVIVTHRGLGYSLAASIP